MLVYSCFLSVPATNLTAAKVLEVWPSPVTYLGGNIGSSVLTGAVLAKTPKYNPVRAGKPISIHLIVPIIPQSHSSHLVYDIYHNGTGIEDGSWDLLATYYGVLGISEGSFKYGNGDQGEDRDIPECDSCVELRRGNPCIEATALFGVSLEQNIGRGDLCEFYL